MLTVAQKKAIRIAGECILDNIQDLAANANLHDVYKADMPCAVRASDQRKKLKEALLVLEEMNGKAIEVEK